MSKAATKDPAAASTYYGREAEDVVRLRAWLPQVWAWGLTMSTGVMRLDRLQGSARLGKRGCRYCRGSSWQPAIINTEGFYRV